MLVPFNIGDLVTIKSVTEMELEFGETYGERFCDEDVGIGFAPAMWTFCERSGIVTRVNASRIACRIDDIDWWWTARMLKPAKSIQETPEPEFKPGDIVRIREWDDMVAEYGTDEDGDIQTPTRYFVSDMRQFCGKKMHIRKILRTNEGRSLFTLDGGNGYSFTLEMLETDSGNGMCANNDISEEMLMKVLGCEL